MLSHAIARSRVTDADAPLMAALRAAWDRHPDDPALQLLFGIYQPGRFSDCPRDLPGRRAPSRSGLDSGGRPWHKAADPRTAVGYPVP
jgi:hypothetical protein